MLIRITKTTKLLALGKACPLGNLRGFADSSPDKLYKIRHTAEVINTHIHKYIYRCITPTKNICVYLISRIFRKKNKLN